MELLKRAALTAIECAAPCPLPPRLELSLMLTDDEGIRALNKEYRGLDKPTDVLSFPQWEGAGLKKTRVLGDIVISLEHAAAQARFLDHSQERETVFLLVHGMLHLLGYDHEQGGKEEQRMLARQRQIMEELGL